MNDPPPDTIENPKPLMPMLPLRALVEPAELVMLRIDSMKLPAVAWKVIDPERPDMTISSAPVPETDTVIGLV